MVYTVSLLERDFEELCHAFWNHFSVLEHLDWTLYLAFLRYETEIKSIQKTVNPIETTYLPSQKER